MASRKRVKWDGPNMSIVDEDDAASTTDPVAAPAPEPEAPHEPAHEAEAGAANAASAEPDPAPEPTVTVASSAPSPRVTLASLHGLMMAGHRVARREWDQAAGERWVACTRVAGIWTVAMPMQGFAPLTPDDEAAGDWYVVG